MPAVIAVQHLHNRYQDTVTVEDVSFTVQEGEIFWIRPRGGSGRVAARVRLGCCAWSLWWRCGGGGDELFDPGEPPAEFGHVTSGAGSACGPGWALPVPCATKLDATCAVTTARVSRPVPMTKQAVTRPGTVTGV